MKKLRYTASQIIAILNKAEVDVPVKGIWRKHDISSATFYKWKPKYGGTDVNEPTRTRELESA